MTLPLFLPVFSPFTSSWRLGISWDEPKFVYFQGNLSWTVINSITASPNKALRYVFLIWFWLIFLQFHNKRNRLYWFTKYLYVGSLKHMLLDDQSHLFVAPNVVLDFFFCSPFGSKASSYALFFLGIRCKAWMKNQ